MRFLLKLAFWLTVVVLLLPSDRAQQGAPAPQISTIEAVSASGAVVSDVRQFCARQPDACAVGSQALVQFGYKAQAGAKMLYEFLSDQLSHEAAREGVKFANTGSEPLVTLRYFGPDTNPEAPNVGDYKRPVVEKKRR